MIPSRATRATRGYSDPMDVDAVNSLSRQAKEKGHQVRAMGVFKCGRAHFQRDCNASKNNGKQSSGIGKPSKSWSKSEPSHTGKGKSRENKGNSKGKSKGTQSAIQGANGVHKGKTSKAGLSGVENFNQKQVRKLRNQRKWDMFVPLTRRGFMMNGVLTN